jgi:hypothetical protein
MASVGVIGITEFARQIVLKDACANACDFMKKSPLPEGGSTWVIGMINSYEIPLSNASKQGTVKEAEA